MKTAMVFLMMALLVVGQTQAFDGRDLRRTFDKSYKCKPGDRKCKNREHLLAVAKVAAVAVAAKFIVDMVIDYRSKKIADEAGVAAAYKAEHANLPEQPVASVYTTSTLPGSVVQPGKKVLIQSEIVVVPGRAQKDTRIEERLAIFDNEDNTKELKSLTKMVNQDTKRAGHYTNEFSFTIPEGLPQGVYPIKTALVLNGKTVKTSSNDIQLVLQINAHGRQRFVALQH
jgi:hypothetical protein